MVLNLQTFLRNGGTLSELKEQLGISAKASAIYPNLYQFKYSQIDSPMGNPIVQECRGVILDSTNDWKIIALPYHKFFNEAEGHAAPINWEKANIYEKLDGSLMILWHYKGKWNVSTSGSIDAAGSVSSFSSVTFSELFWQVWAELDYKLPSAISWGCTFMFELMTPLNQVVVRHDTNKLVLHGVRNNMTGHEYNVADVKYMRDVREERNWEIVKSYPLSSLEEVLEFAKGLNGLESEGFVVFDGENRIKVKAADYVRLHRMADNGTKSNSSLFEMVLENEGEEFLSYFPNYRSAYNEHKENWEKLLTLANAHYNALPVGLPQKEFAAINTGPFSKVFFDVRRGLFLTVEEGLRAQSSDKLLSLTKSEWFAIEWKRLCLNSFIPLVCKVLEKALGQSQS